MVTPSEVWPVVQRYAMKKFPQLSAAFIVAYSSGADAHGTGCTSPQWVDNLNTAIGNICAIWLSIALIYGLFAVRGKLRWQITAKLILATVFIILLGWNILINYVGCSDEDDIFLMVAFNFLPAAFFNFIVYWFRKLGVTKFA